MSCTKTWVCLEMTPASLQLLKRCDRETEDHRAKPLNASAYPFIEISSQLKMQITRNVWVRKQTITFWFWFLSLNLTLPTQRALPARLLGLCVRGEPAWNHFFKFLWPKRKKTPAVLVWMHADKAQKPQQLPTLKAVFSVYTGKFSLQLTRLLFSFFFWKTGQYNPSAKHSASAWKKGSKGPVHTIVLKHFCRWSGDHSSNQPQAFKVYTKNPTENHLEWANYISNIFI